MQLNFGPNEQVQEIIFLRKALKPAHLSVYFNPKKAEGDAGMRRRSIWPPPLNFCKERVKPWSFVTFKIIISHTFPENFIEIPQLIQRI